MLSYHLTIALRQLRSHFGINLLHISGLALGLAVALLIGLWVRDEIRYDRYHPDHERIGQVLTTQNFAGKIETDRSIVVPLGNALRSGHADLFQSVALSSWNVSHTLANGDKPLSARGLWAEPDLPAIMGLTITAGNPNALSDPASLLLARSVADALFGTKDPVGQTVRIDNQQDFRVAAVFADLPANASLTETKYLLSWSNPLNKFNKQTDQWENHGSQLFVQLKPGVSFAQASAAISGLVQPHIKDWQETLLVHPMDRWHLYNEFSNGVENGGRIRYIWLFGLIGIFVLLLACINFMNLSTARSAKRAKEIAVRKTVGSGRRQLVMQFLGESQVVVFLALLIALLLVQLSLPSFNTMAAKELSLPYSSIPFWTSVVFFALITGLIAGSYPALYLSGLRPLKVLKSSKGAGRSAALPRKMLVVFQFAISIALIIGTLVVFRQVSFTKNRPVGYSRNGLLVIDMNTPELYLHYNSLRDELRATGMVADMAEANSTTTEIWSNNAGFEWKGKPASANPLFGTIAVTHDYGNTVGWKIIAGRDFSREFPADSGAFILNESAARLVGFNDPVGKTMRWNGEERVITGVVADMVMESPYAAAIPTVFHMQYGWVNKILVRMQPEAPMQDALAAVSAVFKRMNPSSPFTYQFIDDAYGQKFLLEERIGKLTGVFAGLAILISCLGLFGLATYIAEQRVKELSVRKVLGASSLQLWTLMTSDFFRLVFIALLVTIPTAYYGMQNWLGQFTYRAPLSWWIFGLAGGAVLTVTLLTVSFQAIRASRVNPIKGLRLE